MRNITHKNKWRWRYQRWAGDSRCDGMWRRDGTMRRTHFSRNFHTHLAGYSRHRL